MKKAKNNIRNIFIIICVSWLTIAFVTSAGATLNLMGYKSNHHSVGSVQISNPSHDRVTSHAPEPSTLILFGSGILGMIVSFVRKTYDRAKRLFDLVASIVALLILSPVYLCVAMLVKLTSSGPVLFKQTRVGKDGDLFEIYKFRTMRADAEKESGPVWASKNDSRITPLGGFLRKTRLDEVPQFINVLQGHMSVIGPRPERPFFVEKLSQDIPHYAQRLAVKPGITGLAQVRHKYDETIEDVKKKVKYDLMYIKKLCLWMDLRIALGTFRVVLTGHGAR